MKPCVCSLSNLTSTWVTPARSPYIEPSEPQESASRKPWPGSHCPGQLGDHSQDSTARILQSGFHSQDSTDRIPQPGFHSQDSKAKTPQPGFHKQYSAARIPQPVFHRRDSKSNAVWGRALGLYEADDPPLTCTAHTVLVFNDAMRHFGRGLAST